MMLFMSVYSRRITRVEVEGYVEHSNVRLEQCHRLHRAKEILASRQQEIHVERGRKLEEARNNGYSCESKHRLPRRPSDASEPSC